MAAFLKICLERAGADTLITPREIIRDYMTVLNILFQNPETTFSDVVGSGVVSLKHGDNDDDKVIGDDKPETGETKKPSVSGGISFDDIEL